MSRIQTIILVIFGLFIIIGVASFALFGGSEDSKTTLAPITVWGTLPQDTVTGITDTLRSTVNQSLDVTYVEYDPARFSSAFTEALARGEGPDAILVPHEVALSEREKLIPIPYETLPVRTFKDTYLESTEIYLLSQGVVALPFAVDPLVMYWNRDILTQAGVTKAPESWSMFQGLASKVVKKSSAGAILQSLVAFGDFKNIPNAKSLFSALLLQAGSPIVAFADGVPKARLLSDAGAQPTVDALRFFTDYANPTKSVYSWNRSLPLARNAFLSGDLAVFFSFGSELSSLQAKNPNLNFDIALLPQTGAENKRLTVNENYGFSIARSSSNPGATYDVLKVITDPSLALVLPQKGLVSAERAGLFQVKNGSQEVLDQSALIGKSWYDPAPLATLTIFSSMVESVTTGRLNLAEAVSRAHSELDLVLQK